MDRKPSAVMLEYAVAASPARGEQLTGDRSFVQESKGHALIAVVDGLGHGEEAAKAAELALATVAEKAAEEAGDEAGDIISLLRKCHKSLAHTRGAVMTIARVDGARGKLCWVAVGNVMGMLLRGNSRAYVVQRSGVLGHALPPLQSQCEDISPGDTLVLATDGVQQDGLESAMHGRTPSSIARSILENCAVETDDSLVLVARYLGG